MKISLLVLALAVISASGGNFFGRCAVVHVDESSLSTTYNFYATVPALYFHEAAESYGSLLITDSSDSNSAFYTLEDWAAYLTDQNEYGSIIYVGSVSASFQLIVEGMVPHSEIISFEGSADEIAAEIAMSEWPSSSQAVLCVRSEESADCLNGAAAAAGWAGVNNCPVLWTDGTTLGNASSIALSGMGVTQIWLFDYTGAVSGDLLDELAAMSIAVTEFSDPADLIPATLSLTGQSVACVYKDEMQSLPAALAAARYGGYVLQLPESLDRLNHQAMIDLRSILPMGDTKLAEPVPGADASGSAVLAAEFYTFLEGVGGSDPSQLEFVLTFSDQNVFPATFERSISGDLSDPTRDGAVPGRFPLDWVDNIGTINRGALYEAVIHANPRPDHVTIAMNAYEVQYWDDYSFDDNWFSGLVVNEIFGWPEEGWTAANNYFPGWPPSQPDLDPLWPVAMDAGDTGCCPGQYATFYGEGYEPHFHSGSQPGTGTHPSQPGVPLCGFVQDVIDGSTFLYFSCHGGGTVIAVRNEDNGVAQDNYTIAFGDPYWPDNDGRVYDGSAGGDYYESDLDEDFDNMHSIIIAYNACSMANGNMNEIGLNHGAIGSIGSLASVSFDGSGWWWNIWAHLITAENFTVGEAAAYCNARVSTVYTPPSATPGVDETLQYVLYGDPMVSFVDPGASAPQPLQRHVAYGPHYPDGDGQGIEGQGDIEYPFIEISNPVRSAAAVTLNGNGFAELNVFDLTGRLIATPYRGDINGSHTLSWNTSGLTPGMYFLRLNQGGEVSTARVMVIR
jgi:hypothetical protein